MKNTIFFVTERSNKTVGGATLPLSARSSSSWLGVQPNFVPLPSLRAEHVFVIHNNMCYRSGIMSKNEKTISFRAVAEKIDALDCLAAAQDRPRSYLINEAITNYIELHAYQDALVRKGLEEMRNGHVVSHEQVVKRLKRTGRARP